MAERRFGVNKAKGRSSEERRFWVRLPSFHHLFKAMKRPGRVSSGYTTPNKRERAGPVRSGEVFKMIKAYHDNELVYQGPAEKFLKDNQGDEIVAEMIEEAQRCGMSQYEDPHVGYWQLYSV